MEENNIVDMIQQQEMINDDVDRQINELNEQIRTLRSDNKLLSETVIRMAMKSVGVL